jgi:hypothetical protein
VKTWIAYGVLKRCIRLFLEILHYLHDPLRRAQQRRQACFSRETMAICVQPRWRVFIAETFCRNYNYQPLLTSASEYHQRTRHQLKAQQIIEEAHSTLPDFSWLPRFLQALSSRQCYSCRQVRDMRQVEVWQPSGE